MGPTIVVVIRSGKGDHVTLDVSVSRPTRAVFSDGIIMETKTLRHVAETTLGSRCEFAVDDKDLTPLVVTVGILGMKPDAGEKTIAEAEKYLKVVPGDLAQLKMDKIFILGPEVNIDQVANKAWVVGAGAMQMNSTTTLGGKPLAHPVPLTVHWSDNMLFGGTFAYFHGSIQAEQENARLACQDLQVMFDRPISLKLPDVVLYLRCNRLRVGTFQKPVGGGTSQKQLRTYQLMDAWGQVSVQGKDFTALCDHMMFNEEKDQVIFIGDGDNVAVLSKCEIKNGKPKVMKGKRLIYIRSSGQVYVDRLSSIDG